MASALAPLLTFLAVFLAVVSVWSLLSDAWERDSSRVSERLDAEFRQRQREQVKKSALFKNLGQLTADAAEEDVEQRGWRQRLEVQLEQANLTWTPRKLLWWTLGTALAAALPAAVLRQGVFVVMTCGLAAAVLPWWYVQHRRRARLEALQAQVPDALDTMARVLRAGQTLSQGLQAVAREFRPPLGAEFSLCQEQQNLGVAADVTLRELARRTGVLEMKIFVMALLVQQQTGGSLAEVLDRLAGVVRERYRMHDRLKTLTAESRLQAVVLMALPPLLFVAMLVLKRSYAQVLLERPWLLAATVVLQVVGALWIRRLTRAPV